MVVPWRIRTWILASVPVVLAVGMPWLLVSVYSDRLPERAYMYGWSRTGPDFAHLAPSWPSWAADYLFLVLYGGLMVWGLVKLRHWPHVQRLLLVGAWAVAGHVISTAAIGVITLLDVQGYPAQPTPSWARPASIGTGVAAAVVGWVLIGRLPAAPEAKGTVPIDVPVRNLRSSERVVFSESLWSRRALLIGGATVVGAAAAVVFDMFTNSAVLLAMGLVLVLQTKARVQIDGDGVLLDLPLLRVRRRVPYREVRYARTMTSSPARLWPLVENTTRSGYIGHDGPAVVLQMSDGREFVVTVREAVTAAALVNGELTRRRAVGAEPC